MGLFSPSVHCQEESSPGRDCRQPPLLAAASIGLDSNSGKLTG